MTRLMRLALNPLILLPLLGVAVFLWASVAAPARGDEVPGLGAPWHAYYFSTDMRPVTVHFVRTHDSFTPETARRQPVIATASIPRAYIYFASPYRQPAYPILPDEIWVRQLNVLLVYPGGEPYSLVWNRLRAEGISEYVANRQLRPLLARVELNATTLEFATTYTSFEAAASRMDSTMDGVEEFRYGSSGPYFFRIPENPSLRIIHCMLDVEISHPTHFCDYQIRLSADVRATASFIDFRHHGGADFANERIANIREVLCGFVTCDPQWAATRTKVEGSSMTAPTPGSGARQ